VNEMKTGVELIAAERERQQAVEGCTPEHDDGYAGQEMALAAVCYALPPYSSRRTACWPWAANWWKPTPDDRIRELVKAGALIAAEIDRLSRKESP